MTSSMIILVSFIIYTLAIVIFGILKSKGALNSNENYFLAGRKLGPWVAAISSGASSESGWVMLGLVGTAYTTGISAFWLIPGCLAGILFNWFILAKKFRERSITKNSITIPDYLSDNWQKPSQAIRILSSVIILLAMMAYIAAQFTATGKAFNAVFDISYSSGVILGALIVLAYSVSGGFIADVWTDLIQGILVVFALVFMPILVIILEGGLGPMIILLREQSPALLKLDGGTAGMATFGLIIGWVSIGFAYPGLPHVLNRYMATKDEASLRKGAIIAPIWYFLVFSGAILLGIAARGYLSQLKDPEQVMPLIAVNYLPPLLAGFILAAILSAIVSTADSQLVVATSSFAYDLYYKLIKKTSIQENNMKLFNAGTLLILGVLAVLFALTKNRVIFTFVLYAWAVLGASFAPAIIFTTFWNKFSKMGAFLGILSGAITVVIWKNIPGFSQILYEIVPGLVVSIFFCIIGSIIWPNDNEVKNAED